VSDRSVYSTLAYQGYGRQLDLSELRRLNDWAVQGVWPSLVVFIDAHPDVVVERLNDRQLDRFERAGAAFHQRALDGYHQLIADDPDRWIVVTSEGDKSDVAATMLAAVRRRLTEHGVAG
jgi:dTMP kinase